VPPESVSGEGSKIKRRAALLLGSIVSGLAILFIVFLSHQGLYKIYCLKQERARLGRENARLAEENARLARTIDRLHHDPEMIQDLIRRELNFVKKNEIIVQLPGEQAGRPAMDNLPPPPSSLKKPAGLTSPPQKIKDAGAPSPLSSGTLPLAGALPKAP
jgi:cell division protein FtsB